MDVSNKTLIVYNPKPYPCFKAAMRRQDLLQPLKDIDKKVLHWKDQEQKALDKIEAALRAGPMGRIWQDGDSRFRDYARIIGPEPLINAQPIDKKVISEARRLLAPDNNRHCFTPRITPADKDSILKRLGSKVEEKDTIQEIKDGWRLGLGLDCYYDDPLYSRRTLDVFYVLCSQLFAQDPLETERVQLVEKISKMIGFPNEERVKKYHEEVEEACNNRYIVLFKEFNKISMGSNDDELKLRMRAFLGQEKTIKDLRQYGILNDDDEFDKLLINLCKSTKKSDIGSNLDKLNNILAKHKPRTDISISARLDLLPNQFRTACIDRSENDTFASDDIVSISNLERSLNQVTTICATRKVEKNGELTDLLKRIELRITGLGIKLPVKDGLKALTDDIKRLLELIKSLPHIEMRNYGNQLRNLTNDYVDLFNKLREQMDIPPEKMDLVKTAVERLHSIANRTLAIEIQEHQELDDILKYFSDMIAAIQPHLKRSISRWDESEKVRLLTSMVDLSHFLSLELYSVALEYSNGKTLKDLDLNRQLLAAMYSLRRDLYPSNKVLRTLNKPALIRREYIDYACDNIEDLLEFADVRTKTDLSKLLISIVAPSGYLSSLDKDRRVDAICMILEDAFQGRT